MLSLTKLDAQDLISMSKLAGILSDPDRLCNRANSQMELEFWGWVFTEEGKLEFPEQNSQIN